MTHKVKTTAVGCLHSAYPDLPGGDLLILTGDYTASDRLSQWADFFAWLKKQNYRKKIIIAGNHDNLLMNGWPKTKKEADELSEIDSFLLEQGNEEDFEYLCDSGTEFEALKIWGSPWSSTFPGINPHCMAFTFDSEHYLQKAWDLIPNDTDILITHTPPIHCLDQNINGYHCGSSSLRDAIDRVKPKCHFFSHIHENGGTSLLYKHKGPNTFSANCSLMDYRCRPINKIINVEI